MEDRERKVFEILEEVGAIRPVGHYVYTSGRHGSGYIEMKFLGTQPKLASGVVARLAERLFQSRPQVLLAPATDGAMIADKLALHLANLNCSTQLVWVTKTADGWSWPADFFPRLVEKKKVWVVDDVVTTGGTARALVSLARRHDGLVSGVAAIVRRGEVTVENLGVNRLECLLSVRMESLSEEDCRTNPTKGLCYHGRPINTDFGHGREFLERQLQGLPLKT